MHYHTLQSRARHPPPTLPASCSDDDCAYLIKLGCCKILLGLYKTKDQFGSKPQAGAAVQALVVPSAMVASALDVVQRLLDAGYAADACAAGLMEDIGSPPALTISCTLAPPPLPTHSPPSSSFSMPANMNPPSPPATASHLTPHTSHLTPHTSHLTPPCYCRRHAVRSL